MYIKICILYICIYIHIFYICVYIYIYFNLSKNIWSKELNL